MAEHRYWVSRTEPIQGVTDIQEQLEPLRMFLHSIAVNLRACDSATDVAVLFDGKTFDLTLTAVVNAESRAEAMIVADKAFNEAVRAADAELDDGDQKWTTHLLQDVEARPTTVRQLVAA